MESSSTTFIPVVYLPFPSLSARIGPSSQSKASLSSFIRLPFLLDDELLDGVEHLIVGILVHRADEFLQCPVESFAFLVIEYWGVSVLGYGTVVILSSIAVDESLQGFLERGFLSFLLDDEKSSDVVIADEFLGLAVQGRGKLFRDLHRHGESSSFKTVDGESGHSGLIRKSLLREFCFRSIFLQVVHMQESPYL